MVLNSQLVCHTTQCSDIYHKHTGWYLRRDCPRGQEPLYLLTSFQTCHLVSGSSNNWVRCVTPHSSPTRGQRSSTTIFNILNIFTIIIWIENRQKIAQYHFLLALACIPPPPPTGVSCDHVTLVFSLSFGSIIDVIEIETWNFLKQQIWGKIWFFSPKWGCSPSVDQW